MRGQFATIGGFRLLTILLSSLIFFCHPIKNRLYIPMALSSLTIAFAFVGAAVSQDWSDTVLLICWIASYIAFFVQKTRIENRLRREEAKRR